MVEYSIEEIKKYLNGGVLRQREKLMGSTPSLTYKELGRYYCWYCQPDAFKQIDVILSAITQKQKDIEERKLKERFGDQYIAYMQNTKAIIPWIF